MSDLFYKYYGKTYDLSNTLPVVNGSILRSNSSIAKAILQLLDDSGYRFGIHHPMPPLLLHYNQVDRKHLIRLFKQLCLQLQDFPQNVKDICIITGNGFSVKMPNENDPAECLCKVTFTSDGYSMSRFLCISQIAPAVSRFFKLDLGIQKSILIS